RIASPRPSATGDGAGWTHSVSLPWYKGTRRTRAAGRIELGREVQHVSHHDDASGVEQRGLGDFLRQRDRKIRCPARGARRAGWPLPVAVDSTGKRKSAVVGRLGGVAEARSHWEVLSSEF